ncbi:MAG: glycosyltransferase family 4 protein [Chitinophagales bacterium]
MFRLLLWLTFIPSLVMIYPFVLFKKKNRSHLFFFFDRYSIGGAQRVHLDILDTVRDLPKQVYFTRKSLNKKLKDAFYLFPNTENRDIHFWCDNLLFRLFSVHYFAHYLNRHTHATLLGANSTFFYDMLPFLKKKIFSIELLHNFTYGNNGMEFFGLANYKWLDRRMVIDGFTKNNIRNQYIESKIDDAWYERVELVEFGVDVPTELTKDYSSPLKIIYSGRGGPQKRIWLIDRVASYFIKTRLPVSFYFVGPVENELSELVKSGSIVYGEISDRQELNRIYADGQVLLMTSAYEGFPVVIKETMAYGCVPLVTALEGNKTHLTEGRNALLIEEILDEENLIAIAKEKIQFLLNQHSELERLSRNAYDYAKRHFTKTFFYKKYKDLLSLPKK